MTGYITIGDLALELGTSNQKIGQIITKLDIQRKTIRQGKWYNRCIAAEDVAQIRAVVKDFKVDQTGHKVKPEPKPEPKPKRKKINEFGDNSARLFKNPIVGRYWGNRKNERWGQGIEAYWLKGRCETIGG